VTRIPCPDRRRAVRVLHLEPIPRRPRPIGCRQPLRHDALKAHAARVSEDRSAVVVGVVAVLVWPKLKPDAGRLVARDVGDARKADRRIFGLPAKSARFAAQICSGPVRRRHVASISPAVLEPARRQRRVRHWLCPFTLRTSHGVPSIPGLIGTSAHCSGEVVTVEVEGSEAIAPW
jgi:hypothetical protein